MNNADARKEILYKAQIIMLKKENELLKAKLALNQKEQTSYVRARYYVYEQIIRAKDEEIKFLKSRNQTPEKDEHKCLQEALEKSDSDSSSSTSSVEETLAEFKNRIINEINTKFDKAWHAFKAMVDAKVQGEK